MVDPDRDPADMDDDQGWEPTIRVHRLDRGPDLVIERADQRAYLFFTTDASSVGANAYDLRAGQGDPNRITTDDIVAINTTMRARSPHTAWQDLTANSASQPWLETIPEHASLGPQDDVSPGACRQFVGSKQDSNGRDPLVCPATTCADYARP
jgi:hypothetical protein